MRQAKLIFNLVDLIFYRSRWLAGGFGLLELPLAGCQALLKPAYFRMGLFRRRLDFPRQLRLAGFLTLCPGGCFVSKRRDRRGRLENCSEVRTILACNSRSFRQELAESRLHGLFRLQSEVVTLLLPSLVLGNDITHGFVISYPNFLLAEALWGSHCEGRRVNWSDANTAVVFRPIPRF